MSTTAQLIVVNATCPVCEYPEITGVLVPGTGKTGPSYKVYYCPNPTVKCPWSSTERPTEWPEFA